MKQAQSDHPTLPLASVVSEIAPIILAIVKNIHAQPQKPVPRYYKSILKLMIRHLELFVTPRVSVNAQEIADEMGIGDLWRFQWGDQTNCRRMKDKGREVFHWEHIKPVSDIVEEILAIANPDERSIREKLMQASVAWITKAENAALKPFRRSENPMDEYEKAGICLLPERN